MQPSVVSFLVFKEPPTVKLSVKSGHKSTAVVGDLGNSLRQRFTVQAKAIN